MSIPTPKISKKAITVLSTLSVIGLVYALYFFVYVAGNELEFQEKAFRILDKIGHNIREKQENNNKNVISIAEIIARDLVSISDSLENTMEKEQVLMEKAFNI